MKAWVIDASVGIKWRVAEEDSDKAELVLRDVGTKRSLWVPDFFFLECANILWKRVQRGVHDGDAAELDLSDLLALPLRAVDTRTLVVPALSIARACGATAYDAAYVALAERRNATLITADERLARKLVDRPCQVRLLRELSSSDLDG